MGYYRPLWLAQAFQDLMLSLPHPLPLNVAPKHVLPLSARALPRACHSRWWKYQHRLL